MASPRELVKRRRDAIPGRASVVACVLRCQGTKCPYGGRSVSDVRAGALKRDGPRRGGVEASVRRTLPKGVFSPRARQTPPEGVFSPRARRAPPEGVFSP
jgi:hypothetical protein